MSRSFASLLVSLANGLSLFRVCGAPVLVYLIWRSPDSDSYRYAAFWLVACMQACDMVDGALARRGSRKLAVRNYLGEMIDPIADKLYLGAAFVTLGLTGQLPGWIVALVVARDVAIIAGWTTVYRRFGVRLLPNLVGKLTDGSLALLAGMALLRITPGILRTLTHLVAALAITSGWLYGRMAQRAMVAAAYRRLRILAATRRRARVGSDKRSIGATR